MEDKEIYRPCRECRYYDPAPFPEQKGKKAICRNEHSGAWLVGWKSIGPLTCWAPIVHKSEKSAR